MFQIFLRRVRGSVCRISAVIAILTSISLTFTSFCSLGTVWQTILSTSRSVLYGIAQDTWKFYATDLDPNTHLRWITLPGRVVVRRVAKVSTHLRRTRRIPLGSCSCQ